jgi:hypothetical protein
MKISLVAVMVCLLFGISYGISMHTLLFQETDKMIHKLNNNKLMFVT